MRTEREILREAARIFPKLIRDAGYFAFAGSSLGERTSAPIGIFTRRNRYERPVAGIARDILDGFVARGWIEAAEGTWRLTGAGEAWLRRQAAGAEPFREQHQSRDVELRKADDGSYRPVLVNQAESPIGWLRRRKGGDGRPLIDASQFDAAERLRADFTKAQLTPRVTAAWNGGVSSRRSRRAAPEGPDSINDVAISAKQRFEKAIGAVGPELAGILVDVCCMLKGLEDTEKTFGWPRRSGKVILQIALTALARHYGLSGDTGRGGNRMRHWGSADYRPTLQAWRDG
jgi:hypothetical protein